jgi:hypothetical protein
MKHYPKAIAEFLITNGFKEVTNTWYQNDNCIVTFLCHPEEARYSHYSVEFLKGGIYQRGVMYSDNLNIYWLIGVLFSNGLAELKPFDREPLTYEEWYEMNEVRINDELIESGATRELDFDSEKEFEDRYQKYIDSL